MNQRPIKFRAWDKKKKRMVQNVHEFYDTLHYDESGIPYEEWYDIGIVYAQSFGGLLHDENAVIMQYTGLKDKHGKEIYEGDIIEVDRDYWYDPTGYGYPQGGKVRFVYSGDNFDDFPDLNDSREFEVIGNIYENKELLNEST